MCPIRLKEDNLAEVITMKKGCDYKRREVTKDCLSCAQSFSADDNDGNMILICVKDNNHHEPVRENNSCEEWKD